MFWERNKSVQNEILLLQTVPQVSKVLKKTYEILRLRVALLVSEVI